MSDYLKEDKKKRLKGNLIKIIIILLVFLCLILSYITYDNINISDYSNNENVVIEKTIQTIDGLKEKDKTVIDMIQSIKESIVGISKVKNTGNSIFSADNISDLGLGTGVIVSDNGYILTNAHVSRRKI